MHPPALYIQDQLDSVRQTHHQLECFPGARGFAMALAYRTGSMCPSEGRRKALKYKYENMIIVSMLDHVASEQDVINSLFHIENLEGEKGEHEWNNSLLDLLRCFLSIVSTCLSHEQISFTTQTFL